MEKTEETIGSLLSVDSFRSSEKPRQNSPNSKPLSQVNHANNKLGPSSLNSYCYELVNIL